MEDTSSAKRQVIDEVGAQLRFSDGLPPLRQFLLIFTKPTSPKAVFRRCSRHWINGNPMGRVPTQPFLSPAKIELNNERYSGSVLLRGTSIQLMGQVRGTSIQLMGQENR